MHPENLNSNVIYEISYNCKICIPEVNTIIVAKMSIINQDIVICAVGPLLIFIPKNYIENDKLRIVENEIILIESNSKLKINDYVNILLVDVRINTNDTQIKAIGQLLQGSTEEEILNFYDTE
jgi:DNA-directed RNA polymerase subunit E'/Rpb7